MKSKPEYYRLHPVLSFRVPLKVKQDLELVADADGRPVSQWLNRYVVPKVEEIIEEHKKSPPKQRE